MSSSCMPERPKIICLCGSTRFIELFAVKQWELERAGCVVLGCTLLPQWYCPVADHFAEHQGVKKKHDELHLRKIDLADEVLVLNVDGYIGESTASEIAYATATGKPVRYLEEPERWSVKLKINGKLAVRHVVIHPPFGIRRADAEVKAIREAEAEGGKNVRVIDSYFLRSQRVNHAS